MSTEISRNELNGSLEIKVRVRRSQLCRQAVWMAPFLKGEAIRYRNWGSKNLRYSKSWLEWRKSNLCWVCFLGCWRWRPGWRGWEVSETVKTAKRGIDRSFEKSGWGRQEREGHLWWQWRDEDSREPFHAAEMGQGEEVCNKSFLN